MLKICKTKQLLHDGTLHMHRNDPLLPGVISQMCFTIRIEKRQSFGPHVFFHR